MQNTEATIIARFLQTATRQGAHTALPVDKVIQRFGRPFLTQLTANGHDLVMAVALLRKAYCTDGT